MDQHKCETADTELVDATRYAFITFAIDSEGTMKVAGHYHGEELKGQPDQHVEKARGVFETVWKLIPEVVHSVEAAQLLAEMLATAITNTAEQSTTEEKPSDSESSNSPRDTPDFSRDVLKRHGTIVH